MNYLKSRRQKERIRKVVLEVCTVITCLILIGIIGFIVKNGVKGVKLSFFGTSPSYLTGHIGILPDILNTIYILLITIVLLVPIGVGAAIYLNEYAKKYRLVRLIDFATEILSGIPSIIYGLVGMLFFCQFLGMQTSLLAGAFTLVVMSLPTIMKTTRESLLTVSKGLREGAYALGIPKWRVVCQIVLPECIDGIITGCILASGRILGESAALLFTAGFAHTINHFPQDLLKPGATLTVALYVYAKEQGEFEVAFSIAFILIILSIVLNGFAELITALFKRKRVKRNG